MRSRKVHNYLVALLQTQEEKDLMGTFLAHGVIFLLITKTEISLDYCPEGSASR